MEMSHESCLCLTSLSWASHWHHVARPHGATSRTATCPATPLIARRLLRASNLSERDNAIIYRLSSEKRPTIAREDPTLQFTANDQVHRARERCVLEDRQGLLECGGLE